MDGRRSAEQARLALEVAGLGTWSWIIATDTVRMDLRCCEIVGIAPGHEFSLDAVLARIHAGDRARVARALADAVDPAGPGGYAEEFRWVHADGSVHWTAARGAVAFDGDGPARRAVELFGTLMEFTERVNAEARYRALFDAMDEGFCIIELLFDADGRPCDYRFVETNPTFARQTGLHDALGRTARELLPDLEPHWFEIYGRVATTGEPERFTQGSDVMARWFDVYAFRIGDDASRRVALLFSDISKRRLAEAAVRDADRRKDEFLATLAHELRNPLAPIRTSLHVLKLARDAETVERMQTIMGRQVDQLTRLVDDLMEVSRVTRGKIELRRMPLDLASVLQGAVETARPAIDRAGHRLETRFPLQPLRLHADPMRLSQVVANLLDNAARYSPAGSTIELEARRDGGDAVIRVRDSGIGIAPEAQRRIFDLFTQVGRDGGREHGGLGIGLTLVRSLVELHGGRVEVQSAGVGQGSTFSVRLPLPKTDAASDAPAPRDAGTLDGLRVLVVDDNRDAAESFGDWLEAYGAVARVAHGGHEALAAITDATFDVVLLDLGMPDVDGYEVARRMRADPRCATTRIIAMTGWGQPSDRLRTREAGFDHHMTKPPDIPALHTLLAMIRRDGGHDRT